MKPCPTFRKMARGLSLGVLSLHFQGVHTGRLTAVFVYQTRDVFCLKPPLCL